MHGKCSDELHAIVPSVVTFVTRTRPLIHFVANHQNSFYIPLVRSKFYSDISHEPLFYETVSQTGCFADYYNLKLFKFRINRYRPPPQSA